VVWPVPAGESALTISPDNVNKPHFGTILPPFTALS
jgi:hypothetical protein